MNHSNMVQTVEDQNLVDAAVKAGKLDYVLVRSAMLGGVERAPVKVFGNDGKSAGFMPKISARSVAGFMLDCVEDSSYDGMTPVISN
jgi:hypothetical protein